MTDLERVTARAVECGADDSCGTFHFWPQELLAFEQATLKESVIAVEAIDAGLLSAQAETIEQLQREKAMLVDVCIRVLNGDLGSWESDVRAIEAALESTKASTDKWMAEQESKIFELFGYIEPRKNFEPMEAEAVYIVGEKDFDGCTVALYRRKE